MRVDKASYSAARRAAKASGWTSVRTLREKCCRCGLQLFLLDGQVTICPDAFDHAGKK